MKVELASGANLFKCDRCGKLLSTQNALDGHSHSHT